MTDDAPTNSQQNKFCSTLSKEVIQCLHEISAKRMHLDVDVLSSLFHANPVISTMFTKNIKDLEGALTEMKHWKCLYVDHKEKCRTCASDHNVQETLFRKIIIIIDAILESSLENNIRKEFLEIRTGLEKPVDSDTLHGYFIKLCDLAKRCKTKLPEFASVDVKIEEPVEEIKSPLEVSTETKKEIYYDLLQRMLPLLPNVLDDINSLKSKVKSKYSIEEPSLFLKKVVTVFEKQNTFYEGEKGELRNTILMLLSELNETEKNVDCTMDAYNKKAKNDTAFNENVSTDVHGIESTFQLSEDVQELKKMVKARARDITSNIKSKIGSDVKQNALITTELKTLKNRVKKAHDEAEQYKKEAKDFETKSLTDTLTGISNRRALDDKLNEVNARFKRYGSPCSILICDLDNFKSINDEYGHATGDTVLKKVAYLMAKAIRECDFLGRFGGEEFLAILPDITSKGAKVAAEKIRAMIDDAKFYFKTEAVRVTISIGVTEFREHDDCEIVFERADKALYQAKKDGRNKVVCM